MNHLVAAVLLLSATSLARADATHTNLTAAAILQRVIANRSLKDFSLKGRLFVTREQIVPLELLVKNSAYETRTIFRSGVVELLTVQPVKGAARFYRRGTGELTGAARMEKLLDSHFTCYDLSLPFLHWPNPKSVGEARVRGRDCYLLDAVATNEPYGRVRLWIDKEYFGMVRAEAFDANDTLLKRFAVTSLKRIGDVWIPRSLEIANVPPGQALPAEERSRLEINDGNYDAQLPLEWFVPARFGAPTDTP